MFLRSNISFGLWLQGDTNDDMCKPLFVLYKDCVRGAIKTQNINLRFNDVI